VKIVQRESEGHNLMRDGTFQEKNIYRVCDIIICGLTVWGEHCLDSEQWYSVSNISVRPIYQQNILYYNKRH